MVLKIAFVLNKFNVGVAERLRVGLQIRSMQVRVLSPTPIMSNPLDFKYRLLNGQRKEHKFTVGKPY